MDFGGAFVADAEPAELMQAGDGAFDDPARHAQSAAVRRILVRDDRLDVANPHADALAMRAVAAIGLNRLGPSAWSAAPAAHRQDGVDHCFKLGDIGHIGGGDERDEWSSLCIGDDLVFRAGLAAVRGVRAGRFAPPPTARMLELSTRARVQSMRPAALSRVRSSSWSRCQTPAACQLHNLRQHVMPQHPNCAGRYSHGMPVRRTKRMPSRQARLSRGLRPGWRFRRGLRRSKASSHPLLRHHPRHHGRDGSPVPRRLGQPGRAVLRLQLQGGCAVGRSRSSAETAGGPTMRVADPIARLFLPPAQIEGTRR